MDCAVWARLAPHDDRAVCGQKNVRPRSRQNRHERGRHRDRVTAQANAPAAHQLTLVNQIQPARPRDGPKRVGARRVVQCERDAPLHHREPSRVDRPGRIAGADSWNEEGGCVVQPQRRRTRLLRSEADSDHENHQQPNTQHATHPTGNLACQSASRQPHTCSQRTAVLGAPPHRSFAVSVTRRPSRATCASSAAASASNIVAGSLVVSWVVSRLPCNS